MFAILADGKIIFGWKGTTKYPEEILKIIEELQRLFPTPTTPNSSIDRDSPQAARSLP